MKAAVLVSVTILLVSVSVLACGPPSQVPSQGQYGQGQMGQYGQGQMGQYGQGQYGQGQMGQYGQGQYGQGQYGQGQIGQYSQYGQYGQGQIQEDEGKVGEERRPSIAIDERHPEEKSKLGESHLFVSHVMKKKHHHLKAPLLKLDKYMCALHVGSGDLNHQVIAHHYCGEVSEGIIQCALFDSPSKDAKLIGVEYVLSENLFRSLPEEEKKLWHSHIYEVTSGLLATTGMKKEDEIEMMKKLVSTYGKTIHTWNESEKLPVGIPQLMMAFTADGQANPDLIKVCDNLIGSQTETRKKERKDIQIPNKIKGADAWIESGEAANFELTTKKVNVNK